MLVNHFPKALFFGVLGTCVDWRSNIIREGEALGRKLSTTDRNWPAFADAWRALYQPQLESMRSGKRPWTKLDIRNREALDRVLADFGLEQTFEPDRADFGRVWQRLAPWPDTVEGLSRLKSHFIIAPNSNGNIALILSMAKYAGLMWDAILGAEIARAYKPQPESVSRKY
jgi:2-haloacid dehalogenase